MEKDLGKLKQGYIGSFTILNPNGKTKITVKDIKSKCGWSPLENYETKGKNRESNNKRTRDVIINNPL